jgi:predicted phage terminase large subunit-like protein
MSKPVKTIKQIVKTYFKNSNGKPYEMTDGQAEIFQRVTDPHFKWLWLSAPTRYGKTETLALATIYCAAFYNLKIPIVGGSEEKAKKIMEYVVQHLPDHPDLYNGLINIDLTQVEKLKVTMAKDALRWRDGGWIYVTSVDSRSIRSEGEKVVGEGGDIVILEEAGLIKSKEQFSKVVRMPEENKRWGKLVMSGNCIENSVFETAFNDPLYHKVRVGLEQAIAEGRFNQAMLDQQKKQMTAKDWKRYYLVDFPAQNEYTIFKPKRYEILPNELKYYGAVDLALGEAKKGSLVGITILGLDNKGQVYEVESIGKQMQPDETMRTIFNFPYKFQRFGVEAVQFQKYFLQVIEDKSKAEGKYIPFDGVSQTKKKEERIESMEPFVNTGQILFKGDNELWEEMQTYPDSEYYDVLDSLEMAWRAIGIGQFEFAIV